MSYRGKTYVSEHPVVFSKLHKAPHVVSQAGAPQRMSTTRLPALLDLDAAWLALLSQGGLSARHVLRLRAVSAALTARVRPEPGHKKGKRGGREK